MNIKLFICLIVFISFLNANAHEFKLGKVSIAELQEKSHPKDTSAVAAILFKTGTVYFDDLTTITKVRTKIKIYKKEGYKWANEVISHYKDAENVLFQDANTFNLVDGKIEKTKLKSDGEFKENVNRYFSQTKITMPNVKEGCIIEYEYVIRSLNFGSLREWYFQSSIPVNYSEYKVRLPQFLTFNKKSKGFLFPKLSTESTYNQEVSEVFKLENIPAMRDEVFVNNIDNYRASISHELALVNIPGSYYKQYSTDWASVTKTIYDYDDFGLEVNKTGYFEEDINKLLEGLNTQDEKINAIFNFVKSKVKWNNYEGYSCNDGVKTAYKNKTGNVAEINLMLTAMLRFAKINANPVLLSTRENGIAFFPSTKAFNYVIAAAETPEGLLLLDATEIHSLPNILPLRDLNWYGRLIRKDGTSTEVDLMTKILSKQVTNINITIKSDGSTEGKVRNQFSDYEALEFRKENLVLSKDSYIDALETENNSIEINDYVRENDLDLSKPLIEGYSFKDTKDIEVINGKIYISPLLFLAANKNPFKQEVREYPIDFSYPMLHKYNVNIEIPEGYVVESMPTAINLTTGSDIGTFKYVIVNTDNKIQVAITSTINNAIVAADFYPILKGYYQQMIDKQNEKIVLKKI